MNQQQSTNSDATGMRRRISSVDLIRARFAALLLTLGAFITVLIQPANAADGPAPVSQARRVVSGVHADAISVFAENGGLVLGTKADVDGGLGVRLDPQLTSYNVEESTRTTVPAAPSYAFLGVAGSDVWLAPETNPGGTALWPGFSTEGVPSGLVDGNQLTLRLESVTGPGTLHIYQTSAFGEPSRLLSSTGLVYRAWTIPRGTHAHANWAFSAAGKYTLTFSVEAVTNGVSLTATQNYAFIVGDVPATIATATTLAASTNSLVLGQPVILTAAVTPTNALGWVEFRDGTAVLGHEVVAGDPAALTTTNLALGARSVTARFVPQWLNDFSASTSAPVSITVTDESGVPFSVTGVAASYQPGETLNAQVAGVTLAAGQSIQWRIRPAGFGGQGGIFTGTGPNAAAGSLTQRMDPSFDGYELIAFLRQGTTTLAQTPWVLITVHNAVEPLSIAYEGPSPAYVGDPTTAVVSGRALLNGESFVLVSRLVASRWSAIPQTLQTSERSFVVRPATSFNGKWAVQIVSNSLVVAQSAPIDVQILSREMFVEGVQGVYRPGQVLRATATVFPDPGALTYMWAFTDATATPLKQASDPEGRTLEQPITITDNGRRLLIVAFVDYGTHRGNAAQVVIPISVTALDPSIQLFFFSGLSDHYHQGYPINLNLVADPALADNDVLTWEWRWPNGDWAEFPGASGTHHSLIAEQALHDVQVRATVDFGQEGANPMTTPSLTIKVDDHGAPPSQQIAVTGVTNVVAGNLVTLTGSVSTASILTTYQWQKKPAGASEFTVIPNATSAQLTFTATMLDDGAQYRASILKPNGTVGYGPSPAATLEVEPATPSNTLVPFARPTQHGGTIATEASLVVSADFTGDGKVDVVTTGNSSGSLSFLQGTGDGGFLAERGLNVGSAHRSWTLAAADFDKDGKVDLVTTEYSSTTGEIVHYKNDGTGNFTRHILATGLPLITRSRVGDLNGDGRPDIVYFKNSTTLVFQTGNASGGLDPESIVSSAFASAATAATLALADVNADGRLDVVAADATANQIRVFHQSSSGIFELSSEVAVASGVDLKQVVDLNGDGRLDLLTTDTDSQSLNKAGYYAQLPDGTYGPRVNLPIYGQAVNSLRAADFNRDGVIDIAFGNLFFDEVAFSFFNFDVGWLRGQGAGAFGPSVFLKTYGSITGELITPDLDGDLDPDLVIGGAESAVDSETLYAFVNQSGENPMVLVPPAALTRTTGDPIDLQVYFGFSITVTGTPRIALQVGSNTVYANYIGGNETPALRFRYSVTATDVDLDGVQLVSNVIDLNGGTMKDPLNGDAVLEFPNVAFTGVIVNGAGPLVQGITRLDPRSTVASTVRFQVAFAEPVTGVDVTDFEAAMKEGHLSGASVQSVSGSGSTYQVTVATGTGSGTLGLSVKGSASIFDLNGDVLGKGFKGGQVYTVRRGAIGDIDTFYTRGHADYRPTLNNGEISWILRPDPGLIPGSPFPSDEVITYLDSTSIVSRPVAATYDFLGVPAGAPLYLSDSAGSRQATVPYLGFSGESISPGTFAAYNPGDPRMSSTPRDYIKVELVAMRSSSGGDLSLYSVLFNGNVRVWMASSDGISSSDNIWLRSASHSHFNLAFSKPGTYEVDVVISGFIDGNGNGTYEPLSDQYVESGIKTMVFGVDNLTQGFSFQSLADHYHQGSTINLQLVADPAPAVGDTIAWEWKWPGGDWTPMPGAAGLSNAIVAEQALNGVQVRATLALANTNTTILAGPVTIHVDDHGAPPSQQIAITGVTNVVAGNLVTLTGSVSPASILTTYQWQQKPAGASEFTVISGVTNSTLIFPATMADDGAQYRVAIMKPNGTVAYGPSPVVTLDVAPPGLVPFTMPTFLDSSISSVAPSAQLADLNGDGKPDLAIVGAGVRYLLGTGDGSFLPAQFIQGSSGARNDLVAIDFDGDGDIDLLNTQANAGDTADILSLYRNDGAANFTRVELITSIPRPSHQLEAADLNGDGRPDAVYSKASTGVAYALQQADGSLGSEVVLPVTTITASVQVADLDADGDQDIVVGNRTGSNGGAIFVFKNNGSGTFTAAPSISTGNFPSVLKIADMNGDGLVDILSTQLIANTRIGWYPQLPDGTFGPRVNVMTAVGQLNSIEVADINEDGVPDIVAGVTLLVSGNLSFVSVWSAGQGGGVYSNPILLDPTQGNNTGMLVADLDGDSHPDIIATGNSDSQRPSAVRVLINKVGEDPMVLLTPAARIRVAGDPIDLEIYFGFPVTVTGTPRVALQVGPNTGFATYLSGSGTGRLLFRYLATATDVDLDGVQLASNVIDLNGGTILDPLNGNAALTFPNLAFNGVIVNGAGPLVQNMTRLDPTPTSAPSVRFQVQFAEAVTGVDVADFELKQDAGDLEGGNVLSVTGSGSTYEVSVATGTGSGTLGLSVKAAATITDLAGDPLGKGYVGGQVYTLKRRVPPVISTIYRENHADYRPIWNNGEITFALDADPGTVTPGAMVLPSDEVLTYAGPASIVARAATNAYDFMGVPAGSNVYVLPSSQKAGVPYLGISGESVPSGTFARYSPSTLLGDSRITSTNAYMRFQLVAMRSSSGGHMSIYTISSGNPRVWMATSDGINSMDAVYETPGGHSHRNVAFSKPGTYEVDVFVSGYRDSNGNTNYDPVTDPYIESGIFTMVFHVGDTSRVFAFNRLADHYQQGDPVQLQLVADPVPAVGDTIAWEWRWPGGDWTPMPGAAGLSNSIVAEQALDGVQVRATLNVASNSTTIVAGPVTILMDDNGAPPSQVMTVSGATNVLLAGRRTTLLASVAPASVLTSYRWTIQRTNESSPTVIAGQETATLAFIPTQLDDGAAIRAALVSGNGSNYVESAPVMITVRTRGPGFNFTTARRYTLGHGDLRASYVNGALQVRYEIVSAAIVDGAPADSGHGTNVSYGVHELTVVLPNRPLEMPDIAADPLLADLAFIGAAAGEPVWFIPEGGIEAEQLGLPWLGYNTEELNAGDWTGDKIEIELVSVVAPDGARFSSSFNLDQGNPLVPHFATLDGITAADRFKAGLDGTETGLSTGTHSHVNWYFTKPGRYQVTLRFSGTHLVDGAKETTVTLGFVVAEPAPPAAGLRLAAANPAVGNATLSVATETGKTYQLENAPAVNGPWTSVGAPINGTGEPVQVVVPISGPTGFFRWRVAGNP